VFAAAAAGNDELTPTGRVGLPCAAAFVARTSMFPVFFEPPLYFNDTIFLNNFPDDQTFKSLLSPDDIKHTNIRSFWSMAS
jgi:hypothetical protein